MEDISKITLIRSIQPLLLVDSKESLHDIAAALQLPESEAVKIEMSDMTSFLPQLTTLQKKRCLIVATEDSGIAAICNALNAKFSGYKLAVYSGGALYADALTAELREMAVYTSENTAYLPQKSPYQDLFFSADGRVLLHHSECENATLFDAEYQPWGALLSETVRAGECRGTLAECLPQLSEEEKHQFSFMASVQATDGKCSIPEQIVLFGSDNQPKQAVFLPNAPKITPDEWNLRVFTNKNAESPVIELLKALSAMHSPAMACQLAETFVKPRLLQA